MKKNKLLKRFPQLSLLSFVAACSAEESGFAKGFGSGVNGGSPSSSSKFEAEQLASLAAAKGPTASAGGDANNQLTVTTSAVGANASTLTFTEGAATFVNPDTRKTENYKNHAHIYQRTSTTEYDLVIASSTFTKYDSSKLPSQNTITNEGKIFIFWNVVGIQSEEIGNGVNTTNSRLEIRGAKGNDQIGTHAPELLQIDGNDDYDMVIRSQHVDNNSNTSLDTNEGAIYILWDVPNYSSSNTNPEIIVLGDGAVRGLSIYGGSNNDQIGSHNTEFFKLNDNGGYDMVINAPNFSSSIGNNKANNGAVFILWDVADYAVSTSSIDIAANFNNISSGALAIYGAKQHDQISGIDAEFLQIGGKDDYDMVIVAELVDKTGNGSGNTDDGAIYILWDVGDYYSTGTDKTLGINLDNPADATYGLLTIYGKAGSAFLGSETKGILYGDDGNGKKTLANIDKDAADTIDIVFRDGSHTYILFGDKITTDGSSDADTNIDSKTIDLGLINGTALLGTTAGFFAYDAVKGVVVASASTTDRIGYRFVGNYTDLGKVEEDFKSVSLSDADADLGVWDIA